MTAPKAVRHLTTKEFAARVGITPEAAREWRRDGRGPAYIKDGEKFVRYLLADVEAWELSRRVEPAA